MSATLTVATSQMRMQKAYACKGGESPEERLLPRLGSALNEDDEAGPREVRMRAC